MKRFLYKYISVLIAFLWQCISYAQQPHYFALDQQNGLPSNTIYYTFQDSRGFVWMTTPSGLYRYDGSNIQAFQSPKQTSLAGSEIQEDRYGRIWYINFDGFVYYVEGNELKSIKQNKPVGFYPYGLTERYLFLLQSKGIDVYDLKTLQYIKTFEIPVRIPEHTFVFQNNYYYSDSHILYKIDNQLQLTKQSFFIDNKLKVKYFFPYGNKLLVTSKYNETKKIYLYGENLVLKKTIDIPEVNFIQRADFIDDIFWIHTPHGVFAYDMNGKSLYPSGLFTSNNSSRVFKDHLHNYWFSSLNKGVYMVPQLHDLFYQLEGFTPLRFVKTSHGYIIGSAEGKIFTLGPQLNKLQLRIESLDKHSNDMVYHDSISQLTFFSDKGFCILDNEYFQQPKSYISALKEVIRIDDKYYALAATGYAGLIKNPKASHSYSSPWDAVFGQQPDYNHSDISRLIDGCRAKSVAYIASTHTLYFATNSGLMAISPTKKYEIRLDNQPIFAQQIVGYDNQIFYLDTRQRWFKLTADLRLENLTKKWNLENIKWERIKRFGSNLLLYNNENLGIYDLETQQLDLHPLRIKGHKLNDLLFEEKNVLLLTDLGILRMQIPNKIVKGKIIFHINEFAVNNQVYDWKKFQKLTHDQNNISVKFSVLDFAEKNTSFYYQINNEPWTLINGETREIQFPSLSSGDYWIRFKIGDNISDKNIHFQISTAFWKTWWFYMICSIVGFALLTIYFRWQYAMMKNQMRLLHEKIELEKTLSKSMLASIKAQMNPHFFYNALNTIQAYIFTNDKLQANAYLSKFSRLTRMILEMSEKETISLREEILALSLYIDLEKMRFIDSFTYEIKTENITDFDNILLPPMLIQPFVENAIKHGLLPKENNKHLKITFLLKDNKLIVHIDDNGIGRKKAEALKLQRDVKHQSFSSKANEKRLELLNKGSNNKIGLQYIDKYEPQTGKPLGTLVILIIPL